MKPAGRYGLLSVVFAITVVATIFYASPVDALTYRDFADSVTGSMGKGTSLISIIISLMWLLIVIIALYIAYRISAAQQRREIEAAHRKMMERKNRMKNQPPKKPPGKTVPRPYRPPQKPGKK